jgi:methylisocitrate lyase
MPTGRRHAAPKVGNDGSTRLRGLISGGQRTIAVPGVFNPAVALLARDTGFECLYFSGAAFSNSLGLPDLGLTTLSEVAEAVARISTAVPSLPLIVDIDTGFGEAINLSRTVREMQRAGAAGIQVEDQVMPKRCGHLDGKEVVTPEEMVKRVMSAKAAAFASKDGDHGDDDGVIIIARTDAAEREGLDGAVERARLYQKAGADVIFPEALRSAEEFIEFGRKVKGPLMANMTEFGKTPYTTLSEFSRLGEGYRLVIFPVTTFRVAMKAVSDALAELMRSGTQRNLLDAMLTRDEFNRLIGYSEIERLDAETSRRAARLVSGR